MSVIRRLRPNEPGNNEEGQGLAEYALILALIAIIAVAALMFMGGSLANVLSMIGETVAGVL